MEQALRECTCHPFSHRLCFPFRQAFQEPPGEAEAERPDEAPTPERRAPRPVVPPLQLGNLSSASPRPPASAAGAAPTVETAPRLRDEAVADAPTPAPGEPHSRLSSVPSSKSSSALWRQEHACVVELVARSQAEVPRPAEGPAVA